MGLTFSKQSGAVGYLNISRPFPYVTDSIILNLDAGNGLSYPGTGTTWKDLTSNNNTCTLIGNPTFSNANGGSISFNGSGQYGRLGYTSNFNFSGVDFTLECWFKLNSLGAQVLISKDTNGANYDWGLAVLNSTTIIIYSNGTSTNVSATVPTMSTGTWYHCVISSISGTIRIYLNTTLYRTQAMSISNLSQVYVTIGCAGWNNPNAFTNGFISVARIYRKGLVASEVLQNYNAIKGRYGL